MGSPKSGLRVPLRPKLTIRLFAHDMLGRIVRRGLVTSRSIGLNAEQMILLNMAEDFSKKELAPYAADVSCI
jgi:hypothetical protein